MFETLAALVRQQWDNQVFAGGLALGALGAVFAFHEAEFSVADQLWPMIALVVFGALFVLLPIKGVLAWKGPPETALVVVWLLTGGLIWFLGHGHLWAWLSIRRGERAGLRVAEGDDYLEVAFFVG